MTRILLLTIAGALCTGLLAATRQHTPTAATATARAPIPTQASIEPRTHSPSWRIRTFGNAHEANSYAARTLNRLEKPDGAASISILCPVDLPGAYELERTSARTTRHSILIARGRTVYLVTTSYAAGHAPTRSRAKLVATAASLYQGRGGTAR